MASPPPTESAMTRGETRGHELGRDVGDKVTVSVGNERRRGGIEGGPAWAVGCSMLATLSREEGDEHVT